MNNDKKIKNLTIIFYLNFSRFIINNIIYNVYFRLNL